MILVREAQAADAEVMVRFNAAMAFETETLRLDEDCLRRGVLAVLADHAKGRYFLAEAESRIVGQTLVTYEWSDWRHGFWWWIQSVYVVPDYRRRGVFSALYRHVQSAAETQGALGLRLYVEEQNLPAQETYLNLGMRASHYRMFEIPFDSEPRLP